MISLPQPIHVGLKRWWEERSIGQLRTSPPRFDVVKLRIDRGKETHQEQNKLSKSVSIEELSKFHRHPCRSLKLVSKQIFLRHRLSTFLSEPHVSVYFISGHRGIYRIPWVVCSQKYPDRTLGNKAENGEILSPWNPKRGEPRILSYEQLETIGIWFFRCSDI